MGFSRVRIALLVALAPSLLGCHRARVEPETQARNRSIVVNMELKGSQYRFSPARFQVRRGDTVVFRVMSGFPHNFQFYRDSIPAGAESVLLAMGLDDRNGDPAAPLLVFPKTTFRLHFPQDAPLGKYRFYCLPHQLMGMTGVITLKD